MLDLLVLLPFLLLFGWLWASTFQIAPPPRGLPLADRIVQLLGADDPLIPGGVLVGLGVWVLSQVIPRVTVGTTLGYALAGLRIVDREGKEISAGQTVTRALAAVLSATFFFLGYAWGLLDAGRQTLHDKVAGGYVVLGKPSGIV